MHSSENDAVLISVCEPLNHIHQDTKSARLIAVCKRSISKLEPMEQQGVRYILDNFFELATSFTDELNLKE